MNKFLFFLLTCAFLASTLHAADTTKLGRFSEDPPTLICLGFFWEIAGDDNRNATATVEYREKGQTDWKAAQPLIRIGGFHVGRSSDWLDHVPPHALAGSILDLKPDTQYEVRITAKDPDGIDGEATKTLVTRTRGVPKASDGGNVYHVYPPGSKTNWTKNEFGNLYKAYYGGLGNAGDFNMVWERIVKPGDTILVHAGVYKANLQHYTDPMCLVSDGAYWLTAKGTREKPIVIKAAGDGEVVFDGSGAGVLFNVMAADYHVFEGLTFRNCGTAIFAGQQRVGGCVGLTVRHCRFEDVRDGIFTLYNGARDFYIADNVFIGRNARDGLTGWGTAEDGFLKSNTAVTLQGAGHVVCHNAMAYFWQAYHMGTAFQGFDKGGVACDVYNNDLFMLIDDGIEVDGCARNVRVLRNRIIEVGSPLSVQPVYGGPVYFVRNVAYGRGRSGLKIHEAWPSGMAFYHNTIIANQTVSRGSYTCANFRNNLFLPAGEKGCIAFPSVSHSVAADYDGLGDMVFRVTRIDGAAPIMDKSRNPYFPLKKYPSAEDNKDYHTLAEFQHATGREKHGLAVDYSVFAALQPPPQKTRENPRPFCRPSAVDFRLNPAGAAIDKGCTMPNINDGFKGAAPDLGAYEAGQAIPHYGPRTTKREDSDAPQPFDF